MIQQTPTARTAMHPGPTKIRILFVISVLDRMGGAEKNLFDIVCHLDKRQFQPHVITFQHGAVAEALAKKGIEVIECPVTSLLGRAALQYAFMARRYIRRQGIDIIVTYHHDADIWGLFLSVLAGGLPVVSSRRDMGYQLDLRHVWFYRLFNRCFSRAITVSDAVKNELIRNQWCPSEKLVTIHNGLVPEPYRRRKRTHEIREELGLSADQPVIGSVASFRPIKGQLFLVEAMKLLVADYPKVRVVCTGYNDTDYYRQVVQRVHELGLAGHFIFTGARTDIPDLLPIFDIFVISSVNEGFSNAIIEAMAAGSVVVASNSGGNPESVEDTRTGLLFKACDSQSLSEKLRILLDNPQLRCTMGQRAQTEVRNNFHLEKMIMKFQNVIKETARCETQD